jgi:hypothetical protein
VKKRLGCCAGLLAVMMAGLCACQHARSIAAERSGAVFVDGQGVAVMANSDNGQTVGAYLIRSIAEEYGWNSIQSQ